ARDRDRHDEAFPHGRRDLVAGRISRLGYWSSGSEDALSNLLSWCVWESNDPESPPKWIMAHDRENANRHHGRSRVNQCLSGPIRVGGTSCRLSRRSSRVVLVPGTSRPDGDMPRRSGG